MASSSRSATVTPSIPPPLPPPPLEGKKGKRKAASKTVSEDGESEGGNKKRNRVHFSCSECSRRKQKCDRQSPCNHCLARKVPHLCRPFVNGVEDPDQYDADVRSRLDRIESLLANLQPDHRSSSALPSASTDRPSPRINRKHTRSSSNAHASGSSHARQSSGEEQEVEDEYADEADGEEEYNGVFKAGKWFGGSAMSSVTSSVRMGAILQTFPSTSIGATASVLDDQVQHAAHAAQASNAQSRANSPYPHQHQHIGALSGTLEILDESGIGLENITALLSKLPGKDMRNALVELYWREIDWTRYHLYQPTFQERYMAFFSHETSNPYPNEAFPLHTLDAGGLKWLPLLFIIMAISTLTCPLSFFGDEETRRTWSKSLYGSARKAMNVAKALQKDNLDILYAGLLIGRYLLLTRRAAEGYTPLTIALQLGLYRDGTQLGIVDKREIELRRRAWSAIYHHDRTASLLVGRPTMISDESCDTRPPANLSDADLLSGEFPPEGRPLSQPTLVTQAVLRHSLAIIQGQISSRIFSLKNPSYSTVVELDRSLIEWKHNLPSFFKLEKPDKSLDSQFHFLQFHRHMLASEFYYVRVILHRPYMLRGGRDSRYAYSRKAAVEAARADLIGRRDWELTKPKTSGKASTGSYWLINSYIIIGLALLHAPAGSAEAEELRNLLNVVSGKTADDEGRVSFASVRELAIVELFNSKSRAMDSAPSSPQIGNSRHLQLPSSSSSSSSFSPTYPQSFAGAGQRSILHQEFLGGNAHDPSQSQQSTSPKAQPPRQLSVGLGSGTNGLWGLDPVDALLSARLSNQKAGISSAATSAANCQPSTLRLGNPNDSAWSARAVGMDGLSSLQRPSFGPSPSSSAGPSASAITIGKSPFQPAYSQQRSSLSRPSFDPSEINNESFTSQPDPYGYAHQEQQSQSTPMISVNGQQQHQPTASSSSDANAFANVFGVGSENDFLSPWSHAGGGIGAQAFSTFTDSTDDSGEGGFGGLGEDMAFLNTLISAISSGPSQ